MYHCRKLSLLSVRYCTPSKTVTKILTPCACVLRRWRVYDEASRHVLADLRRWELLVSLQFNSLTFGHVLVVRKAATVTPPNTIVLGTQPSLHVAVTVFFHAYYPTGR